MIMVVLMSSPTQYFSPAVRNAERALTSPLAAAAAATLRPQGICSRFSFSSTSLVVSVFR